MNTTARQRTQGHKTFPAHRVVVSVSAVLVSFCLTLGLSAAAPSGLADRVIAAATTV